MRMRITLNEKTFVEVEYEKDFVIKNIKSDMISSPILTDMKNFAYKDVKNLTEVIELLYRFYIVGRPLTEGVMDYILFIANKEKLSIRIPLEDFIETKKNLYKTKNKSTFFVTDKTSELTVLGIKIGESPDDIEIIKPIKNCLDAKELIDIVELSIKYKEREKWVSENIDYCEKALYDKLLDGRYNFTIGKYDNGNFKIDKSSLDNKSPLNKTAGFKCLLKYRKGVLFELELNASEYKIKPINRSLLDDIPDSDKLAQLWSRMRDIRLLNPNDITVELIQEMFEKFKPTGMKLEVVYEDEKTTNTHKDENNLDEKQAHPNFSDVVGMDKIKERLNDVIHQFKNEEQYEKWNIEPIRAILLYGPSGTGKSFIAEALSNEIDAEFIKYSASDIFHQYVGESEAAVRKLFDEARNRNCKTVIFIDEVDAVANKRTKDDKACKNSTLNELLVQMSSPDNQNIFMIFATNMFEMLDPAFLRSGRVDFKIEVGLPDYNMRKEILELYSKNRPLDDDVDLAAIAKDMSGKNCADVKLVANEAARSALKQHKDKISQKHFKDAYKEMIVGLPDKNRNFESKERHITAIHETGHLLANILLDNNTEIKSVSILPRGSVLGYVHSEDKNMDKYLDTKTGLFNQIKQLLAGRAAEELMLGEITTGAANDLEVANNIARNMVVKYGMSDEFGFVIDDGYDVISKEKATTVVRNMLDDCYEDVKELLKENIEMLVRISEELEDKEELNESEIKVFIEEIEKR